MTSIKKINLITFFILSFLYLVNGDWGLGIGDWGLGIGDWAQSPIPNPQSPIPNPQSPFKLINFKHLLYFSKNIHKLQNDNL